LNTLCRNEFRLRRLKIYGTHPKLVREIRRGFRRTTADGASGRRPDALLDSRAPPSREPRGGHGAGNRTGELKAMRESGKEKAMARLTHVCAVALIVALAVFAAEANAASTADITVTVTIQNLSVSLSSNTWALGTVVAGSTTQMTEADDITVTNDGNVDEDFTLKLTDPSAWTAGATAGADVYVMSGLFCASADAPGGSDFQADDVLTTTTQTATSAVFGYVGGSDDGVAVPAGNSVDLWLEFQAPTSTTNFTQQTIVVTVGAVAS